MLLQGVHDGRKVTLCTGASVQRSHSTCCLLGICKQGSQGSVPAHIQPAHIMCGGVLPLPQATLIGPLDSRQVDAPWPVQIAVLCLLVEAQSWGNGSEAIQSMLHATPGLGRLGTSLLSAEALCERVSSAAHL